MARDATQEATREAARAAGDPAASKEKALTRVAQKIKDFVIRRWAVLVVGLLLVSHVVMLGWLRSYSQRSAGFESPEVSLGVFDFVAGESPERPVASAKFHLHVSLLREAERPGRILLALRQNKVKQEVEQLLRQAQSRDFADPTLAELKRQLQEMINETLGRRVVDEVIITDLSVERAIVETAPAATEPASEPTPTVPGQRFIEGSLEASKSG
jgi:hypothetical protein